MKRTVLVIDDETNMQRVMRMVLGAAGHEVLVADKRRGGAADTQRIRTWM